MIARRADVAIRINRSLLSQAAMTNGRSTICITSPLAPITIMRVAWSSIVNPTSNWKNCAETSCRPSAIIEPMHAMDARRMKWDERPSDAICLKLRVRRTATRCRLKLTARRALSACGSGIVAA